MDESGDNEPHAEPRGEPPGESALGGPLTLVIEGQPYDVLPAQGGGVAVVVFTICSGTIWDLI